LKTLFTYDENDVDGPYGPSNWGKINKNCDGSRQSPINLIQSTARAVTGKPKLTITGSCSVPSSVIATNNGHSASFRFKYCDGVKIPTLTGGPLEGTYVFDNMHFHWGEDDIEGGSEHTLNGKRYAAEVHFVTFNQIYGK
jgi:carbonic anhydrase